MVRIAELLAERRLDALERRLLLACASGLTREDFARAPEASVSPDALARYRELVARREEGVPIAHLLGGREFYGHHFQVNADVLIPRPETEGLVDLALDRAPLPEAAQVVDVGTGSGCIAIALKLARPAWRVTGLDVSPAALAVARRNARRLGASVTWRQQDLRAGLAGRWHLIVANPPYIAAQDPHLAQGDLRFEPRLALTDESDGLSLLACLASQAPQHLWPRGWILMEHGFDQAPAVRAALLRAGLLEVQSWSDLAGLARISGGRAPGPA